MSAQSAYTSRGVRKNWDDNTMRAMYLALVAIKLKRPDKDLLTAVREAQEQEVAARYQRNIRSTKVAEQVWERAQMIARAAPRSW